MSRPIPTGLWHLLHWICVYQNHKWMGNNQTMCCQGTNPKQTQDIIMISTDQKGKTQSQTDQQPQISSDQVQPPQRNQERIQFPEYNQNIKQTLRQLFTSPELIGPFESQLDYSLPVKKFGNQIYQGPVNEQGQPHGYGRMSYSNGSLYIGQFFKGVAVGEAFYFDPLGSYYKGKMSQNKANDENAIYKSKEFQYKGSILNNQFDGRGQEQGDRHSFAGTYKLGKRTQGTLKWKQKLKKKFPLSSEFTEYEGEFIYTGLFDSQQNFTGESTLSSPLGTYKGQFVKGVKEGKGIFLYLNGIKYQGKYKNNMKEGEGTIYNKDSKVAYCGQMKGGLPNGKGWIPGQNGHRNWMDWRDGISSLIIQNQDTTK